MAGVDDNPSRRRYYPDDESVPLTRAIYQALEAHDETRLDRDEIDLYKHVNPEALNMLFEDVPDTDVDVSVQLNLTNVTISIWSDGGIDIRVTEKLE